MVIYDSSLRAENGPRTAISYLPSVNEWSKVNLINTNRKILAEWKNNHNVTTIRNDENLPDNFSYVYNGVARAARLLTAQEVMRGCGLTQACTFTEEDLASCEYLFESTNYLNFNSSIYSSFYILETLLASQNTSSPSDLVLIVRYDTYNLENSSRISSYTGVRPAIEVPISDIQY